MNIISSPYLLLESIKVEHNQVQNFDYHQKRIAYAMQAIYNCEKTIDFSPIAKAAKSLRNEVYKLRVEYNKDFFKYRFTLTKDEQLQV